MHQLYWLAGGGWLTLDSGQKWCLNALIQAVDICAGAASLAGAAALDLTSSACFQVVQTPLKP